MSEDSKIEVDEAVLANDNSDYESSGYNTSTASVTSSVNEYIFENGRRYHAYFGPDKNMMPTDEIEQDRLDMHHEVMLMLLEGQLHKAPLKDPQRILDVGCGTGIWAIDMADTYPSAEVIGTDLSPIQPKWVPPNCRFEVDDAELDFTYRPDSFDFVHLRNLAQSISDWPKLLSDVCRVTKPGGYVELAESGADIKCDDGTMAEDNAYKVNVDLVSKALTQIGRPPATDAILKERLEKAGFVDIQVVNVRQPMGPWPKDQRLKKLGAITLFGMEAAIEAYSLATLTRILKIPPAEVTEICRKSLAAAKNKNTHMYAIFHVVYGRKPTTKK
ncbi:putative TAM domain methyltransferase [Trichophaea hybrida]|nr:putative TAM domain methyltransferase [Trichophaea hybrida]